MLARTFHPLVSRLADALEATWREHLTLREYPMPADLGYIEGELDAQRVAIENRCFAAPPFRKLHLELAKVGPSLDILHCVMFPQTDAPLPIFGCDLVGNPRTIGAAIADLSPVVPIPSPYEAELRALEEVRRQFRHYRELPAWGGIFSPYCVFVRLETPTEEQAFLDLAVAYARLACRMAMETAMETVVDVGAIADGQRRYCAQQRQNDKTRRILEKAFGPEWTERYMTTVLFDVF
ncbi:MAG: phycocyanobilin:ferredoxin oxidoreductase [Pseudanabaenaceae cyanobacterium]